MKKFNWGSKRLVYMRGIGNPDFQQYADVALAEIKLVSSIKEAQSECQKYIAHHQLGGGNWYTLESPQPGDVYDMTGKLVGRIEYNAKISKPEEERCLGVIKIHAQFGSWNERQANRLEEELKKIGAINVVTEDWTEDDTSDQPTIYTFCNIKCQIQQLVEAVRGVSARIAFNWVEFRDFKDVLDPNLKPCPFCGGVVRSFALVSDSVSPKVAAVCDACGSQGATGVDKADAIAKWNTRAN
jgi:Lar family restriction alleviation protein